MMIYILAAICILIVIRLIGTYYKNYCVLKEIDKVIDDLKEKNKTIEKILYKGK